MKEQNCARRKSKVKVRTLLYHANQALDGDLPPPHNMVANPRLTARGPRARRENSNRCGFARAVRSEQSEDFPRQDFERNTIQRNDVRFGLLVSLAASPAKPAPS